MSYDKNVDISFPNQNIVNVDLEKEMKKSYIDYAMSVIVGRALPDVRDGLKPVHRRILYTMHEAGLTADKPYKKSATTVGDVLGSYHPHGDASVYDALVRLAQDFSLRYPLVSGHGNFGSIDGDPAAAYRYTEARMSRIAAEMLRDIDKDTVDWAPNYDDSKFEPTVLPSRFPNLLVNGSSGIAVGMTTNIPPHNLREVIDATICLIEDPEAGFEELFLHVKGPDFPTKGIIMGKAGIRSAYATGRGRIKLRARTVFDDFAKDRVRIIVTELPYQVNKARLIETIANNVKDKRIDGISGLRDESGRDGMRIVIELKRDANPQVVLNRLFASTQMQTTFAVIMLALVNNQSQPKVLSLKEALEEYIAHQKDVIIRRTEFELKKALDRAHLLEGLRIAVDNIDEVIRLIRQSYSDARERLMERFELSEIQARAILDMQLRRLQGLEREKIEDEYQELQRRIAYYRELLASPAMIAELLITELSEIKDKYGDERQTEIEPVDDEIDIEDLIDEDDCCYTLTRAGYIKRLPANTYRAQRRGGKGIIAMSTRDEDSVETLFIASTHDYLLFFTDIGKVHRKKGYLIPEAGRTAKGTHLNNVLPLEEGEKVTTLMPIREFNEDKYLFMTTKMGRVKQIRLNSINTARKAGIRAITLEDDDALISAIKTDGKGLHIIATYGGMAICFSESDVRPMGRSAMGVRGIRLKKGDYVIGAEKVEEGADLLSVTENGYGKRTPIEEFIRGGSEAAAEAAAETEAGDESVSILDGLKPQRRGGKGLKAYHITKKTGKIADVCQVTDEDDVMIISDDGTIIRLAAEDISVYRRDTQGVILMRMPEDSRVISIERSEKEEAETDIDEDIELDDSESGGGEAVDDSDTEDME